MNKKEAFKKVTEIITKINEPTVAQKNRIHQYAIMMLQQVHQTTGAYWENVVVEMYRRTIAHRFKHEDEATLTKHHKDMKKGIQALLNLTKKSEPKSNHSLPKEE